jgi:hypothetical protein
MVASNDVATALRDESAACIECRRSQSSAGRGIEAMDLHEDIVVLNIYRICSCSRLFYATSPAKAKGMTRVRTRITMATTYAPYK